MWITLCRKSVGHAIIRAYCGKLRKNGKFKEREMRYNKNIYEGIFVKFIKME
ncbi:hypothetical protein [Clostridium chauvoei]|uniref:hypothetical protein n=1 Tax=Clostridium chauvoei TaxID=46867 RepID=UPI000356F261|nr:hypothetical protein [Clostridium chauvoei]CDG00607.1 Hypothetical protein CCH01_000780 [Clostridium chauvoei JF4335]MBX7289238.1 hypothetical protein [Clostridium chauvoei]MBX7309391.1 hypothetical protein [Clostridium chauvoei]MBX7319439.1 hypothetical protein [Clostridium chauvoei]MBX7347182.1 hypothetical protein [Clostridium chauvoei]